MLTEQAAYSNRWRQVSPYAKGCFAVCGLIAAALAGSPRPALIIAGILAAGTVGGAAVPLASYLRIAAPALLFLATSALSLLVSITGTPEAGLISLTTTPAELARVALLCSRSLACLSALLFLALTTPLPDIITILRRCRVPDTFLDLMVLCYRTLFVLSETIHETRTAQAARLGHATTLHTFRSLASLITNLTTQVWQRSLALHHAAEARNNDGALVFLEHEYPGSTLAVICAMLSGATLILLAVMV